MKLNNTNNYNNPFSLSHTRNISFTHSQLLYSLSLINSRQMLKYLTLLITFHLTILESILQSHFMHFLFYVWLQLLNGFDCMRLFTKDRLILDFIPCNHFMFTVIVCTLILPNPINSLLIPLVKFRDQLQTEILGFFWFLFFS